MAGGAISIGTRWLNTLAGTNIPEFPEVGIRRDRKEKAGGSRTNAVGSDRFFVCLSFGFVLHLSLMVFCQASADSL